VTTSGKPAPASRAPRAILLAVALVLIVSASLRFYRLGVPSDLIFDEVYYAKDAKTILDGKIGPMGYYKWEPGKEISWPHPEMGKFAIAAGIAVAHNTPLGRRLTPAIAGFLIIALVYPIARRLGLSPEWALAALVLAAADPLGIAQSRIATLDVFVAFWTVLCIYLTLRYVQEGRRRRWLALAGLSAGMALGTKWSGALAPLAALVLLVVLRERRQRPDDDPWMLDTIAAGVRASIWPIILLVVLPPLVYFASYTQYFASGHLSGAWWDLRPWWVHSAYDQWWELQRQMWYFNLHLSAPHTYASKAGTWIFDARPVWYYFQDFAGKYHGIVAIGNPILWWSSVAALAVMTAAALRPVMSAAARVLWWTAVAVVFTSYYSHGIHIHLATFGGAHDLELSRWFFFWISVCWTYVALGLIALLELARRRSRPRVDAAAIVATVGATALLLALWLVVSGFLHRQALGVSALAALRIAALAVVALWPVAKRRMLFALPAVLVALLYLPWFKASRTSFLYYMTPVAPFMAIVVAQALDRWSRARSAEAEDEVDDEPSAEDEVDAGEAFPADRRRIAIKVAAFVALAIATALLWYVIAHGANRVFWALPHRRLAPAAAYVAAVWGIAVVVVGLALLLFLRRLQPLRAYFAWGYIGLVVGIAIAFLPVIIDIASKPADYYHLMWFRSWI